MNLNQFTIKGREALELATQMAVNGGNGQIETGHLLLALHKVDDNVIPFLVSKLGVNIQLLIKQAEAIVSGYPKVSGGEVYASRDLQVVLNSALKQLSKGKDEFVTTAHLFLALSEGNDSIGKMLRNSGITPKDLESAITELNQGVGATSATAEETYNSLNRYARNLNELASAGKLDPVIGRDEEIRRVLQILTRRTKNNPILIGEPGVGKTAIAEGIAHRIVNGDVPENLKSKLIFSLDMGALVAGAKYKGEFEERLKSVVKEVISSDGSVVLFIDEIHTLVGAGGGEGAMDAANILKPALARGELRAIGATTLKEYQKFFEKDKALERRFQIVMVDEPDTISAISILRGLKERYEAHHHVRIRDEAIVAAVELSQRYITDRFLPDKAIDLVDEAAARLRLEMNSLPEELETIERKVKQLEIEREAMVREGDSDRIDFLKHEIANLQEERNNLRAKWQSEKEIVDRIQATKTMIEEDKLKAEQAERNGDYGLVAELRYGKIRASEQSLITLKEELIRRQGDSPMINEEIGAEEIAGIVSKWTGIPVTRMLQSEREKLLNLEAELHKRVVGQDDAITAVSDAIRRSRAGLQDSKRPIGSFIFLGSTGVGKTELAKALAGFLFNDENSMVRIDMSEFQERHSVSRLIGAPPGYVGYDESGQLTEAVRRKPYSVVLLDEIEKAHPDVFNILLQVLDDGRLTDNKGRIADFKNTIIIMTSNLGSQLIQERLVDKGRDITEASFESTRNEVMQLLKRTMRPEFLNRIDEIIMFTPLSHKEIREVVVLQFKLIQKRASEAGVELQITDGAIDFIARIGFDPLFGARPVKRIMQREILNQLSKLILAGSIEPDKPITIDVQNEQIIFRS
ncbi:MAG: ATP-dependent chaperone ClpB [Sphingobacteriia bacterium]|nr:ATP-dependent chaperone ClpB [Sphingobacteriia bacterium]